MRPFHLDVLVSGPTLFMGIGAFLWIPLSLAVGRRPVFLLCNVILLLSTAWAWAAGSFYQLLVAACLQGLAMGISASTVSPMTLCLQRSMLIGKRCSLWSSILHLSTSA